MIDNPRGLVADGYESNCEILSARLGMDELEIITASDGIDAFDNLKLAICNILHNSAQSIAKSG